MSVEQAALSQVISGRSSPIAGRVRLGAGWIARSVVVGIVVTAVGRASIALIVCGLGSGDLAVLIQVFFGGVAAIVGAIIGGITTFIG